MFIAHFLPINCFGNVPLHHQWSHGVETQLKNDLDKIFAEPEFKGTSFACKVETESGEVLYSRHPLKRLVPASNNKLFSTSYALFSLGSKYFPTTSFWKEKNGLYISSNGNPLTTEGDILKVVRALKINPHQKVFLHEAYMPGYNENWELGDLPNQYAAPVTALTIDRGILYLWNNYGHPEIHPRNFGVKLVWQDRKNPTVSDHFDLLQNKIYLQGALPKVSKMIDNLSIPHPDLAFASYFGQFDSYTNKIPARKPDYILKGPSLESTLRKCLQESDNNLAENSLFLGATHSDFKASTYPLAIEKLNHFIASIIGIPLSLVKEDDGSGLSRENSVSPEAFVQLLKWHLEQPNAALWRSLLDHPGGGTLVHRMTGVPFQGKTGTMTRISAISGYLGPFGKKTVILSDIEDNYLCSTAKMKSYEDQIISTIYKDLQGASE